MKTLKKLQDIQSRPSKYNALQFQNNLGGGFNRSAPAKREYRSGTRTTLFLGLNAALWTFLGILFIFQFNRDFHGSLISQVGGIIAGLGVGGFLGVWFTRRQLATLENKSEIVTTLREILYFMAAGIIFIAIMLSVGFTNSPQWLTNGFGSSVFAGGIAIIASRFMVMSVWEKRKKKQIFQDRYRIYVATQESTDNAEYKKDLAPKTSETERSN